MTVIAVANQKGGVGKTTTVVNLGAGLHELGYHVLLVDNDPQGSLALSLGVPDTEELTPTLGDLLIDAASGHPSLDPMQAILPTASGMDLLPCNTGLAAAELGLVQCMGREFMLKEVLSRVADGYDFVVLDCLPGRGVLAVNGLSSADGVVVPVQVDYLAIQGLSQVLQTIGTVQAKLNPALRTLGVVLTMIDSRTTHSREVISLLRAGLQESVHIFDAQVHHQVGLKDSVARAETMLKYRPASQGAAAYRQLAHEVVRSLGLTAPRRASLARVATPAPRPDTTPVVIAGLRVNAMRSAQERAI